MEIIPQAFILLGLALIFAELVVGIATGFDLVLIGTILVIGGTTGIFFQSYQLTLILSALLSLVYIAYGRRLIKSRISITTHKTNIDKLVGAQGIVIRSITPDTPGLIRLDDEDWRATSDIVLYEKDRVIVDSLQGVTLHVSKIKN